MLDLFEGYYVAIDSFCLLTFSDVTRKLVGVGIR